MYIIADIGGTKMRVAGSRDLETFDEPVILDTPKMYTEGLAAIIDAAKKSSDGKTVDYVMIGITGVVSDDNRTPHTTPHLPDWRGKPLAADLEAALGGHAYMENDTALVGLGEALFGAGKGASIVVYVTVSTGVGAVRIIDGMLERGHPEIGGQYLTIGDAPRPFEDLISGTAISEKYGVHPRDIEKDSPVWEELARITAYGLHNTILHWSPDRVVLGGSMFNEIGISVNRVAAYLLHIMRKFPSVPEIVHSSLTDRGGLWGALARLKQLK